MSPKHPARSALVLLALLLAWPAAAVADEAPQVGERVVVHHRTWLHRAPDSAQRWSDDRGRADNQTDYLVFSVTGVREGWVEVAAIDRFAPDSHACYDSLPGMVDLGLKLWVRAQDLQQVTTGKVELPQADGSRMALLPGVVVVPGPVRDGQMAATVHEHGLRIPVTLPVDRLGRSNRPESPEPGPVTTLLLGGDSRLHFAGERVDLSTSVSTLSLRKKDDAAVEFATSCGEYRLLREPPAEGGSSSSAGSTSGSSDTSLILGIGVIGGSESSGTLSGSVSSFDEVGSVAVGTASEPAATSIPSGTTVSWPDGAALDPLPRNLLTFDPRPTPTDDGRVCYDVTLSMWACPSCQDNVTLCFAAP